MPLQVPIGAADFAWRNSNFASQPLGNIGTSFSWSASNTKGNWAQCLSAAAISTDVYLIQVTLTGLGSSAVARSVLVDIGTDPAGGTSFTAVIPNLLLAPAGNPGVSGGIQYTFPLGIRSGSTIGVRAQANTSSGTGVCLVEVWGKPRNPKRAWRGSRVTAYGPATGTSLGTAITSGTTSDGTYTSLGTTSEDASFWQLAFGSNDATLTSGGVYTFDLAFGNASFKSNIVENQLVIIPTSAEDVGMGAKAIAVGRAVPSGATLYGRLQCSGTADSPLYCAAYGVR